MIILLRPYSDMWESLSPQAELKEPIKTSSEYRIEKMPLFTRLFLLVPVILASSLLADEKPKNNPNEIFSTSFENNDWRKHWDGAERKTIAIIEKDPTRKFEALEGKSLSIITPKGKHFGASLEFPFNRTSGGEPSEIYFRYYLRLGDDWDPVGGGKLPGIGGTYGKAGWGGRPSNGSNGWSARGLFKGRKNGKTQVGFYCYHAEMKGKYGDNFIWDKGRLGLLENNRWYCIEQHAKLNSVGKSNGVLRAWIDGKLAFEKTDIRMRNTPKLKIEKIWINLYHGGGEPSASDDHVFIDNIVISREYIGPVASKNK